MTIETKKQARELLGVNENASEKDIKNAYRQKARSSHTDKGKGGSAEKMGYLNDAKDILLCKSGTCAELKEKDVTYKSEYLFNKIFFKGDGNKVDLIQETIDHGANPKKYSGFINPIGSNENIKIHGLSYFEIAEIYNIDLPYEVKSVLKDNGATEDHTIGYHFYKKALLKEMNYELKVTQTSYGKCLETNKVLYQHQLDSHCGDLKDGFSGNTHVAQQGIIENIFPSPVEVTARMDGNIDFKVIHTGASVVIQGNKLTAASLLKAISKSNTDAPKGFNGLDYLMANKDLFDYLVDPAKHYVEAGASEHRVPSNFFSEHKYIELNPDIKEGVDKGWLKSGFFHFVNNGCKEGRSPDGVYNENSYVSSNEDLAHHKNTGSMECAYFHCIDYGMFEGRVDCVDLYASS